MRRNISVVLAIGLLLGYVVLTWAVHNRREADKIIAVLNAERQLIRDSSHPAAQPGGQMQFDFTKFASGVHAIDTQGCPGDFSTAWVKFNAALDAVAAEKPGAVNPADLGETNAAVTAFKTTFMECQQAAARHGVRFH
jgi:hypothetical protein